MADDKAVVVRSRKHLFLSRRRRKRPVSSEGTAMLSKSVFFLTRATPGHAENGVAYLTIVSPTADRLTAVSSPVAKKAELHTMSMGGGVMKMRPLTAIDIPAGQAVTLNPGGMHIMLLGLTQPLHQGQSFPLTLSFDHAGPREVTVLIEASSPTAERKSSSVGSSFPPGRPICRSSC
jgi:copper(I)-binding protein